MHFSLKLALGWMWTRTATEVALQVGMHPMNDCSGASRSAKRGLQRVGQRLSAQQANGCRRPGAVDRQRQLSVVRLSGYDVLAHLDPASADSGLPGNEFDSGDIDGGTAGRELG